MRIPDYYAILQVESTASPAQITASYKHLEKTAPLFKNSPRYRMAWIREAYYVLSNPKRRAHYDFTRMEYAVEPGVSLNAVDELFEYPSTFVSMYISRRNHNILYTTMAVIVPIFLWALFTGKMEIAVIMLSAVSTLVGFGLLLVQIKESRQK